MKRRKSSEVPVIAPTPESSEGVIDLDPSVGTPLDLATTQMAETVISEQSAPAPRRKRRVKSVVCGPKPLVDIEAARARQISTFVAFLDKEIGQEDMLASVTELQNLIDTGKRLISKNA